MKQYALLLLVCAQSFALWSCASPGSSGRGAGTHRTQVEREALVTVTALDVPNRLVTVRNAAGENITVYVDKSNKAFPQAGVGDQVRMRYIESFVLHLTTKPQGSLQISESTSRPKSGQTSGKTSTEVTAVVRINAVNQDGSLVSFTGPRGHRAIQVQDPAMRDYVRQLQPGDHVEVTYEEALALSLEKV